jgi:hypothetical protein
MMAPNKKFKQMKIINHHEMTSNIQQTAVQMAPHPHHQTVHHQQHQQAHFHHQIQQHRKTTQNYYNSNNGMGH